MFSVLTPYFFEEKKIAIPGVGIFKLEPKSAATSFATVEAPGWHVAFTENKETGSAENTERLYQLIGQKESLSAAMAKEQFESFARTILEKLNAGEKPEWPQVGILEKNGHKITFVPFEQETTLFTPIAAQKVVRENADHHLLIGEKETSAAAVRELHQQAADRPRSNRAGWIVLIAAAALAGILLFKNGCSISNSGNREKVPVQKSPETYKLK